DSALYVAAAACLGPLGAGWLVAVALTLDALVRPPPGERLVFAAYFGGMTGGLLYAIGWLWGGDAARLAGAAAAAGLLRVLALGITLLVAHYLIQGVRLVLAGHAPAAYLRRMALPGIAAEASLLPLAAVVVLVYRPDRPIAFAALGATYLLVNFVFSRLSRASESLRQRVSELETLNRTAHALASTLKLHELTDAIARETLAAVPEAELMALSQADGEDIVVDWLDRERRKFERVRTRE